MTTPLPVHLRDCGDALSRGDAHDADRPCACACHQSARPKLEFGALAPCRTCNGTGRSRNPDWGDKDQARQRQRQRRHGQFVDKPTELVTCVECAGRGYMAPEQADARRDDRDDLWAVSVAGPKR